MYLKGRGLTKRQSHKDQNDEERPLNYHISSAAFLLNHPEVIRLGGGSSGDSCVEFEIS